MKLGIELALVDLEFLTLMFWLQTSIEKKYATNSENLHFFILITHYKFCIKL
jgi:hypothetical protein